MAEKKTGKAAKKPRSTKTAKPIGTPKKPPVKHGKAASSKKRTVARKKKPRTAGGDVVGHALDVSGRGHEGSLQRPPVALFKDPQANWPAIVRFLAFNKDFIADWLKKIEPTKLLEKSFKQALKYYKKTGYQPIEKPEEDPGDLETRQVEITIDGEVYVMTLDLIGDRVPPAVIISVVVQSLYGTQCGRKLLYPRGRHIRSGDEMAQRPRPRRY